jgi:hypothetical protein
VSWGVADIFSLPTGTNVALDRVSSPGTPPKALDRVRSPGTPPKVDSPMETTRLYLESHLE